jgi:chaperonin cofactor prefoldin
MSDYDHLCKIVGNLYLQTNLEREKLVDEANRVVHELRSRAEALEQDKKRAEAERDELLRALSDRLNGSER